MLTRSGWFVVLALSGLITAFAWAFLLQDEAAPMASAPRTARPAPPVETALLPGVPADTRPVPRPAPRPAPAIKPEPRPAPEPPVTAPVMPENPAMPALSPAPQVTPAPAPSAPPGPPGGAEPAPPAPPLDTEAPSPAVPEPPGPVLIQLPPEDRDWMLADMRKFLATSREVMELAVDEDFTAAEKLARSLGPAYARRDPALLARLPSDFRARDRAMRDSFDALADFIAVTPDTVSVIEAVNAVTAECAACHDAYRIGAMQAPEPAE